MTPVRKIRKTVTTKTTGRGQLLFRFFWVLFVCGFGRARGQETSPELALMHSNAKKYAAKGNTAEAIIIYKQLISLSPRHTAYETELAGLYLKNSYYNNATETILPVVAGAGVTDSAYRILIEATEGKKDMRRAERYMDAGLKRFPQSALLCLVKGNLELQYGRKESARTFFIKGIAVNPEFAENYKEAAMTYEPDEDIMWSLLYMETYLNLPHDTAGDEILKRVLYNNWKVMFDGLVGFNGTNTPVPSRKDSFETACKSIFAGLTPVMSDGLSAENLAMVRIRLITNWIKNYKATMPYSLFTYHETLIRQGWFDIYNEWLFGAAESKAQHEAWKQFHAGDKERYLIWRESNRFIPSFTDDYNPQHSIKRKKNKKR
ncbi:MAG: hypothetical protein H7257_04065 [Taibaiella sp.]|nr:hypothetical protein [Taibaiella sp.]